jgi:hypothetical protein
MYAGQYHDPVRDRLQHIRRLVRDVSAEFANEIQRRADLEGKLEGTTADFVEFYTRRERQLRCGWLKRRRSTALYNIPIR